MRALVVVVLLFGCMAAANASQMLVCPDPGVVSSSVAGSPVCADSGGVVVDWVLEDVPGAFADLTADEVVTLFEYVLVLFATAAVWRLLSRAVSRR
jgi:hypothetical protein